MAGMRPEPETARDSPFLVNCRNRRPTPNGAKHFIDVSAPISDADITALPESKVWPYPQYFRGKAISLMAFGTSLYEEDANGLWQLIDTKNPDTGASASITPGTDWHFVDLHTSWMLFNFTCVVWKTGKSANVYVTDQVSIATGCVHKHGRVLMAGFNSENFYARADWPAYWESRRGELPPEYRDLTESGMGPNWVRWGSYMAPDLLDLLDPSSLMDTDLALDLLWRHEAGGMPLPVQGYIVGLEEFGSGVVAYGLGGIRFLDPVSGQHRYAPYEFTDLGENVGVLPDGGEDGVPVSRTHWAGNKKVQYFVDGGDDLWRLTPDLKAVRLGFREYISELNRGNLLLGYDSSNDELYLGDGTDALLLSKGRMCRPPCMPTRITSVAARAVVSFSYDSSEPDRAVLESGTFTTESGKVETLVAYKLVGLNPNSSNGWRLKIKYRIRAYDEFTTTQEFTFDERNYAPLVLPVLEWRWLLESSDASAVTVEDMIPVLDAEANPAYSDKLSASTPVAATE